MAKGELKEKQAPVAECTHYWVIAPAIGPVSQGMCQRCGQTKEFKNYVEASTWGDELNTRRKFQKRAAGLDGNEEEDDA